MVGFGQPVKLTLLRPPLLPPRSDREEQINNRNYLMQVTKLGRKALIQREAKRYYAYPDPASDLAKHGTQWGFKPARQIIAKLPPSVQSLSGAPWTCGIGATGPDVTIDSHWDDAEIERRFKAHLAEFSKGVSDLIPTATPPQFDAMVSLAFNIGIPAFRTSTVRSAHNRGDYAAAQRAFGLFNKAQRKVNQGLVNRRAAEAAQYAASQVANVVAPVPVAADPERSMASSEINIAAAAAAVSATVGGVGGIMDAISGKETTFLFIAIVVIAGYVIYQRVRQRKGGWA